MKKDNQPPVAPAQKTLKDFTIDELKSLAYDQLVLLERCQVNLRAINEEINLRGVK